MLPRNCSKTVVGVTSGAGQSCTDDITCHIDANSKSCLFLNLNTAKLYMK